MNATSSRLTTLTIDTLVPFLFGNRQAILTVASARGALGVGLLLVFSAALAREYDGEDLLHEPWHLLIPLGASLASSFILYLLVRLIGLMKLRNVGFLEGYAGLLAAYWMTAPLAWLYAIPVEHFLSPADATRANLWLLAIVSVWRVALMARVLNVLFDMRGHTAFFIVMLFSDTLALVVLRLTPLPVIAVMGGVRLSESEHVIQDTAISIAVLGVLSWPAWLVGLGSSIYATRRTEWSFGSLAQTTRVAPSAWGAAAAAFIIGCSFLPFTQPAQQRRWQVERDLTSGRIDEALAFMAAHSREDFPPHWDPPPRIAYGERRPDMLTVIERILERPELASWVKNAYSEKMDDYVDKYEYFIERGVFDRAKRWKELTAEERLVVFGKLKQSDAYFDSP